MNPKAQIAGLVVATVLVVPAARGDIHRKAGSTGMSFLKLDVGARASAMAGAFAAVSGDQTCSYWNPAGLIGPYRQAGTLMHCQWFQGIHYEYAGWAASSGTRAWGIGLAFQSSGELELRGLQPASPRGKPPTFSVYDLALAFSHARQVGRFNIGVTGKVLYEKIHTQDALGVALDMGLIYAPGPSGLSIGSSLKNLGRTSAMREETIRLPLVWQMGGVYERALSNLGTGVLFALDARVPNDSGVSVHAGMEYRPTDKLALRGGYQTGAEERNIAMGFGIRQGALQVDYAYVPYYFDLGDTHRISLGWRGQ